MKIAIIGAGIGGLSSAIQLLKMDHSVDLFERAPVITEVGATISLWPNATWALKEIGVLEECIKNAAEIKGFQLLNPRQKLLREIQVGNYATPAIAMQRADLISILASKIPPQVLNGGCEILSIAEEREGVFLVSRNRSFGPYELLIGADGLRSIARGYVRGDNSDSPKYSGYLIWRGLSEYKLEQSIVSETRGPGAWFGIVPVGRGRVHWFAQYNEPNPDYPSMSSPRLHLLEIFGNWHAPIRDLLEATPESAILRNRSLDRSPQAGWSRGRVILVGDAAHPSTPNLGQGGCMASRRCSCTSQLFSWDIQYLSKLEKF